MYCKSVLVVEDNEDIRESVAEVLRMEGFCVETAVDGKDALQKLESLHEPLILLDMMMPVMNGWEFLDARKASPRFSDRPVVVVSALPPGNALLPDSGLVHAEGLLEKPINIFNLLKIVQTYCEPGTIPPPNPEAKSAVTQTL